MDVLAEEKVGAAKFATVYRKKATKREIIQEEDGQ